jgi:hypothetical protein
VLFVLSLRLVFTVALLKQTFGAYELQIVPNSASHLQLTINNAHISGADNRGQVVSTNNSFKCGYS